MFAQQLIQAKNKENKFDISGPLWGESIND